VYVAGKDLAAGVVHVAAGHDHPALLSSSVLLQQPHWVAGAAPAALGGAGVLHCQHQARYRQAAEGCSIRVLQPAAQPAAWQFSSSRFCAASVQAALQQQASGAEAGAGSSSGGLLVADLHQPLRGVAVGQVFVMYDGPVCLGSAVIAGHGPTLFEQQQQQQQQKQQQQPPQQQQQPPQQPPQQPQAQLKAVHV
jgi:tRNA-specific 2-thiouridylase